MIGKCLRTSGNTILEENLSSLIILLFFKRVSDKKKYHLPLFFSQFLCIFSDGYIFIYKRDNNILKIKFIMEVMIAILLFGIFLINSLFGLNLISRIDNLIEINEKERRADE